MNAKVTYQDARILVDGYTELARAYRMVGKKSTDQIVRETYRSLTKEAIAKGKKWRRVQDILRGWTVGIPEPSQYDVWRQYDISDLV